ncbi:MAG: DUF501 domain-containing protein [Gammaproteobacteria bacterium]|nr:DUF501 domain-containing protein [Gammaproteobacteria bacterium]
MTTSIPTPTQLTLIEQQLGRSPRGLKAVAAWSNNGIPLVLTMHPLVGNKPFPTLYWLCSKDLHKAINQLETAGLVKQLEQKLKHEPQWMAQYQQNQRDYIAARWANCSKAEVAQLESLGFTSLFEQYGIGGLRDWRQIRCLHMQYAHHLSANNVIGQYLDEHYGLSELNINL